MKGPLPYRRVAILGVNGQVGAEIVRRLGFRCVGLNRSDVDLTNHAALRKKLRETQPDLVINAAAFTNVDLAESEQDGCFATNAGAVAVLAELCQLLDCPLIQISTDYVFGADTLRREPYLEADVPGPVNAYGHSKLAGEQAAAVWSKHLIVRTCGLYSAAPSGIRLGRNFCDTILWRALRGEPLRVVSDQVCTPTYVPHFVDLMFRAIDLQLTGVVHATAVGSASWYELAQELCTGASVEVGLTPISSGEFRTAAARPSYSVLKSSHNLRAPDWRSGCREYLRQQSDNGALREAAH